MAGTRLHSIIAHHISGVFGKGVVLSSEMIRFIASTWDVPEQLWVEDFRAAMAMVDDPDTLMDLIVYPDEPIQIGLEPILDQAGTIPPDEYAVISHLVRSHPRITIMLPENGGCISLAADDFFIARFVKRLHVEKIIPAPLKRVLPTTFTEENKYKFFVRTRNSRIDYAEDRIDALCRFVEMFPESHEAFWDGLAFILEFLTEIKDARNMVTALVNRRKVLSHHIDRKMAMDDHLTRVNMETFLLTGNRVSGIDVTKAAHQIGVIRSILYHVYNVFDLPGEHDKDVSFTVFSRQH